VPGRAGAIVAFPAPATRTSSKSLTELGVGKVGYFLGDRVEARPQIF